MHCVRSRTKHCLRYWFLFYFRHLLAWGSLVLWVTLRIFFVKLALRALLFSKNKIEKEGHTWPWQERKNASKNMWNWRMQNNFHWSDSGSLVETLSKAESWDLWALTCPVLLLLCAVSPSQRYHSCICLSRRQAYEESWRADCCLESFVEQGT